MIAIQSEERTDIVSVRLDEVNDKVHEMLALAMDHNALITRKSFNISEKNTCENLKNIIHIKGKVWKGEGEEMENLIRNLIMYIFSFLHNMYRNSFLLFFIFLSQFLALYRRIIYYELKIISEKQIGL